MIIIESLYDVAKDLLIRLKKKNYFDEFSQQDLFYLNFSNENKKMVLLFIDSFFGESYGIQLFYNKNGFKYLHNIFTTPNPESITIGDCDAIFAVFKNKDDLLKEDINYLRRKHKRVKDSENVIFYRFESGYSDRCANDLELSEFILAATFMLSLLKNDYKMIKEALDNSFSVICDIDTTKYMYEARYQDLPYLITDPRNLKVNKSFVEEFKNAKFTEEKVDFYALYLPIRIKETRKRVMLNLIYYHNLDIYDIYYILDKTTIKSAILGMFYESFNKHGMPLEINLCHNDYKSYVYKTMSELNIEVISDKVSKKTINIAQNISNLIFDLSQDSEFSLEDAKNILEKVKESSKELVLDDDYTSDSNTNNDTYIS